MPSTTNEWYLVWQRKLHSASLTSLRSTTTLCAFNALVDNIVNYDAKTFTALFNHFEKDASAIMRKSRREIQRVDSPQLLLSALLESFRSGKAMHLPTNFYLVNWLERVFPRAKQAIGGQAGIIANQVALLGGRAILYTEPLSPSLANLFSPRVQFPIGNKSLSFTSVHHAANQSEKPRQNFVIEYKKGDVLHFAGSAFIAPRTNRLILSSPHNTPPLFAPSLAHFLPELGERIDAGIMSGYHSLQPVYEDGSTYEHYLSVEELYLKTLKAHRNIPLHVEYVSTPYRQIDKEIYEHITKHVDSFGLNEVELIELCEKLGFSKEAREIVKKENVVTLHNAAEKVMHSLHLKRLHVHNLGYHLVLLKKPIDVTKQRKQANAVLYGSLAATSRALHGREITRGEVQDALQIGINENAFNQMARLCAHLSLSKTRALHSLLTGVFDLNSHVALVIPGQVTSLTRRTTGLGDTVSACSFLAGL